MPKRDLKDKGFRTELTAQALEHIAFSRRSKQVKVSSWQKNENMYYGQKVVTGDARANVDLGRMQEFVHTFQSKIKNNKIFKFTKRKKSQLARVNRLNALRAIDQQNDSWDIKFTVAKKQLVIYGRMIFCYYADSLDGYKPHLSPIDIYDFLIDPSGNAFDIDTKDYMGDYGVVKYRDELEDGMSGRDREYLLTETKELLDGAGNNTEKTQEETNKQNRTNILNAAGSKETQNKDKFKFWRWFETFEGERYYMLLQEQAGRVIKIQKLTDLFSPTKYFPKGPYPYWTVAAYPDLTEIWTPAPCDSPREPFMAQNVSINQMLDNAEEINKPMKVVNTSAIENMAELKYRRGGYIKVKGDIDANKAIQILRPPEIKSPMLVFDKLEAIQEKASGVTAGAKGVEDTDGKVAIYEGNQQEVAGRFDLYDQSLSFGINRFGRLYEIGVRDNLTKKIAIDMIGPEGIETEEVSRRDIFHKADDFGLMVESSNAETVASIQKQSAKLQFINGELANPVMLGKLNPKKAFEIKAKIVQMSEDEIKELLDTSEYGDAELLSEAARDIEALEEGETIQPNGAANNAYKQKIVDFMTDHQEDMDTETFNRFALYVASIDPIVMKNEARAINAFAIRTLNQQSMQPPGNGPTPAPTNPVGDPNAQIQDIAGGQGQPGAF